VSNPQLIC